MLIDEYENICNCVSTESQRFSILRKKGFFYPDEVYIGSPLVEKLVDNEMLHVHEMCFAAVIHLRKSFKMFLELPGMFNKTINYINVLKKEKYVISNIMQAVTWLNKYAEKYSNTLVLPFFIFFDEFECGNPLGSHAGSKKFGGVFTSLACLPPNVSSKISSIIFSTLIPVKEKQL